MLPDSHGTTQSNFMSIGRRTLGADRSRGRGTPDQQFDTGKLTRAQTATNNDIRTDGQEEEANAEEKEKQSLTNSIGWVSRRVTSQSCYGKRLAEETGHWTRVSANSDSSKVNELGAIRVLEGVNTQ